MCGPRGRDTARLTSGLGREIKDFGFSLYFSIDAELELEPRKIARDLYEF
jgi:hypothetical protein